MIPSDFNVGDVVKLTKPLSDISIYNDVFFTVFRITDGPCIEVSELLILGRRGGSHHYINPEYMCKVPPEELLIKILTEA